MEKARSARSTSLIKANRKHNIFSLTPVSLGENRAFTVSNLVNSEHHLARACNIAAQKIPMGDDDIYFNKLGLGDCHIGLMKSQRGGRRKASFSPWRVQGMLDTFSSLSWNISLLFSLSVPCQSVPVQQPRNAGQEQPSGQGKCC